MYDMVSCFYYRQKSLNLASTSNGSIMNPISHALNKAISVSCAKSDGQNKENDMIDALK